jgi:GT2 family glycosyltransferase
VGAFALIDALAREFPDGVVATVRALPRLTYLHFWTCNVSVKRAFMREHGMFDESFLYYEDVLCGHRLERAGMELRFVPEARGQHLHQLKPAGVASKGRFTGLWLQAFLERVPDPAAKVRFGVIARDLPRRVLAKRLWNRAAFRLVDNPATRGVLRLLGATNGRRSRASDAYYYLAFRRAMLAGYAEAKARARAARRSVRSVTDDSWVNRGES